MQIRIYFDEVESPRDLTLAAVGEVNGTHVMNNEEEYVSMSFQAGELKVATKLIAKYLKK